MSNLDKLNWHVAADASALARDAAERIFREARHAIGERDRFNIVLAGGNTPEHTYRYLARGESDWSRWQVFFGDEKLNDDDDELLCNYNMAKESFLNEVAIPRLQVHRIMVDAGFDVAVDAYLKELRHVRTFDLVLLGMGTDGHTASLFPGREINPIDDLIFMDDAPFEHKQRVSMNYHRLNEARKVFVIISGADKRPAVKAWLNGDDLPISRITGLNGVDVLIDRDAYPE